MTKGEFEKSAEKFENIDTRTITIEQEETLYIPYSKVVEARKEYPNCGACQYRATSGGKCRALKSDECPKDAWFLKQFGDEK